MEALYNRVSESMEQTVVLDEFEQAIEGGAEYFVPVSSVEQGEIEAIIAAANATENVNIRLSIHDIEQVRQKSAAEGLPYQTLIASIIHKYITGVLVDEQAVLKSMQLDRVLAKR